MMPAFQTLTANEKKLLVTFLYSDSTTITADKTEPGIDDKKNNSYKISGYTKFLDEDGHPAITPPWGTLNAIDLNTGAYVWKNVFGDTPALQKNGDPQTGAESYGGPIVTAGDVLFIAGTKDQKFRAYNKSSGTFLHEWTLPAASFATPATYMVDGKQYVVLACGGTKLGAPKGECYIAFSLPDR
jgi:quinoprotein glucose dehydrogenase